MIYKRLEGLVVSLLVLVLCAAGITAAGASSITRASGGNARTPLGYGIILNKGSSLQREWVAIRDPSLPAALVGTPGVTTKYKPDRVRGEYLYEARFAIETKEALAAVHVRFLLFDVWGDHIRTLGFNEVADMGPGRRDFTGEWRLYSEAEASRYYASIGYVARIRTKSGRIISADTGPVLEEAQRFSTKFTAEALEPSPDKN